MNNAIHTYAVRKAVISSALIKPTVFPSLSNKVREPLLVVEEEGAAAVPSRISDFDRSERFRILSVVACEADVEVVVMEEEDVLVIESPPEALLGMTTGRGRPLLLLFVVPSGGVAAILRTLTPWPVIPLAGR